jgi:hypothetical protein
MSLCGELALEEAVELLLDKLRIYVYLFFDILCGMGRLTVTDGTAQWVASSVTMQQQKLQSCLLCGKQITDREQSLYF